MIAVFFGTFNARHAANALLAEDLRKAGVSLRFCHEPLWEETRDKDSAYFAPLALVGRAFSWAGSMMRLARRFRRAAAGAGLVVTGFNGQLDVLVARLLSRGRPLLFAPLVTITETLVEDRRQYEAESLPGRILAAIDRASLRAADLVLADTEAHRCYLIRRLDAPAHRVAVHYLGAESLFAPAPPPPARPRLHVLVYGSYLPLHGFDVVADAARRLGPDGGVCFELIGDGPERPRIAPRVRDLPHVTLRDWVAYEDLPGRIADADVVLGIFGRSEKARMVVPNKVYQAAQVGRAIVTADTPAIREVFRRGESIVAISPEPEALVRALRDLAQDAEGRARLGARAAAAVARLAAPEIRARRLAAALDSVLRGMP